MSRIALIPGALLLAVLMAAPASAQDYRFGLGLSGGRLVSTDYNNGSGATMDLTYAPTTTAGMSTEWWFGRGRLGLRLGAAVNGAHVLLDGAETSAVMNSYFGDASLMVRLFEQHAYRWFAPYVAIGAGAVHYNPGGPDALDFSAANALMPADRVTSPAGTLALGFDLPFGLRVEVSDFVVYPPPFDNVIHDEPMPVHHISITGGLHLRLGHLPQPLYAFRASEDVTREIVRTEAREEEQQVAQSITLYGAEEEAEAEEETPAETEAPADSAAPPIERPAYAYAIAPTDAKIEAGQASMARTNPFRPEVEPEFDLATGRRIGGRADVTLSLDGGRQRRWTDYPVKLDFPRGVVVLLDRGDVTRVVAEVPLARAAVVWIGPEVASR